MSFGIAFASSAKESNCNFDVTGTLQRNTKYLSSEKDGYQNYIGSLSHTSQNGYYQVNKTGGYW